MPHAVIAFGPLASLEFGKPSPSTHAVAPSSFRQCQPGFIVSVWWELPRTEVPGSPHSRTSSLPPSSQVRGLCGGELLEQTQQYVSSRAEAAAGVSSGDGTGARPLVPPADAAALFCASFQSSCDQAIEEFRDAGLHFGKDDEFGRGTAQAQAQAQAQNEVAKMMFLKQQVLRWG